MEAEQESISPHSYPMTLPRLDRSEIDATLGEEPWQSAAQQPAATEPPRRDPVLWVGWWITGAALVTLLGVLCGWVLAQVRLIP